MGAQKNTALPQNLPALPPQQLMTAPLFTVTRFQTLWPSRLTWVKPNAQIFTQMRFFSFEFSLLE